MPNNNNRYHLILPFGWLSPISDLGSGEKLLQLVTAQLGIHEHLFGAASIPVRQYPSIFQCLATKLSIHSSSWGPDFDTLLFHRANSLTFMLGFTVTSLFALTDCGSVRGCLFAWVIGTTRNRFCIRMAPPSLGCSWIFTVQTPGLIGRSTFGLW